MKKFDFDTGFVNAPPVTTQSNTTENKSTFPLEQLLQILPKLNLNGILNIFSNKQNQNYSAQEPQVMDESFVPTQNFMRTQNLYEAQKNIQEHRYMVNAIRTNNKKE